MINDELSGKRVVDLDSARWEIRRLIMEMAEHVLHTAAARKNVYPYQVGCSELHYRWLIVVARDLVEKVETDSTRVRGTDITPSMILMAQTTLELLEGRDLTDASNTARRMWGHTDESVCEYAPKAIENIKSWMSRKLLASMNLKQVLSVFRESGYDLTPQEFLATFEARHKGGPDQAAWQRLSSYLRATESEIADLIDRHKRYDA